jgi:hypothetical protein
MDVIEKKQDRLQRSARLQIEELGLHNLLSPFGRVAIVGSVATGLMTWPDIDIEVAGEQFPSKKDLSPIEKALSVRGIEEVSFIDNRDNLTSHLPKGMYLGFKKQVGAVLWKIDIWFIEANSQNSAIKDSSWIMDALTPEKKTIILTIKNQIAHDPTYRKSIFSLDIYKAVLLSGVSDLAGFKEYLALSHREMTIK